MDAIHAIELAIAHLKLRATHICCTPVKVSILASKDRWQMDVTFSGASEGDPPFEHWMSVPGHPEHAQGERITQGQFDYDAASLSEPEEAAR